MTKALSENFLKIGVGWAVPTKIFCVLSTARAFRQRLLQHLSCFFEIDLSWEFDGAGHPLR